ncbi:MAG: serine/threonine protein kinase, partial [Deltaproteobacteria bacterium]|nr:serine/threonine protein kinase [Deltaproteobacteria bacterium]
MGEPPSSVTSTVDADPGGTTSRVFAAGAEDEVTGVGRLLSSLQAGLFGQRGELQTIGRYEVLRRLGSGGAGVVYRGRDPELGREVAIKLLRADQRGTQWRERMLREAQAMAKVEHPNVIEIYDVGVHRDGPDKSPAIYIVMELIDGLDLHKWWNPERAWTEVIEVYLQAARGLEAAHRHGLVHRDFKPSNVMLDERGRVRVLDFGLVRGDQPSWSAATISASDPEADYAPLTGLTETGGVLGTPPYMAPEQHAAQEIDARADQYSLCVALFEALYRERPFPQTTLSDLQEAKTSGHVVPVERRDVPVEVDAIVRRGLSPDPDDRFASMTQVVGALERCLKPPRRTRRILAWVGAVTITVAAAATVVGVGTQACKDGTIAPLWTEARAVGVRETFVAASSALGATTADRVGERLQARDQRTQHTWTTACDEREQGRASAERLGAIERCLEERQAEAEAVLDAFTEADARMVSTALSAVYQLSPPAGCLDPPPSEPKHDEPSYRALSTEVARLKGMAQAGQLEQALVRGEALVARAEAAGHAELEARLRYRLGLLLVQGGDAAQGIEHLEKSALLAAGQRDHGTAVAAWAGLAQWHASEGGSLENARKALRHAEAAAELLPGDASSQRLLWSVRGIIA